ncbi:MAG TPA: T9SS type A sorting domain-containing protein, partial [Bacteroidota bacterium]|nr:T9SS type A sorting domain-containing protein [Bacteroidota bacterium]
LADSIQSVSCLAQDPRVGNQNNWYYGTGELLGNSASGGGAFYVGDGVYKSTNSGTSWQKVVATASWTPQIFDKTSDIVWDVVVDPTNGNVYAALYGQIIRSTNGGTSWSSSLNSTTTSAFSAYLDIAVTSSGVFYAAISSDGQTSGIFRSTTGASGSWVNITPVGWPSTYNRTVLAIAPSNEKVVYFLLESPGSGYHDATDNTYTSFWKYTYVSGDGSGAGGTWSNRSANMPAYGGNVGNFTHQAGYDLVIKVKPDNPDFVFIGGTNLYRSSDGFASTSNSAWIGGYSTANDISQMSGHHCDEHALAFKPGSPATLLSGSDGGISRTTNDSTAAPTWTFLNNGYLTSQFYSIAVDQAGSGDATMIGGMQDNSNMMTTSTNGSTPWVVMPGGGDGCFSAIANGKTYYYIGTQNGNVYRLNNPSPDWSSYTWTVVTPSGASGFMFVTPYALDPNNSNIMYMAGGSEVWRNSNLSTIANFQNSTSTNWTGLTKTNLPGHDITAVGVSTTPANRLYYGTDSTRVFRMDNANVATGSTNPTEITGGTFPADAYVSCIAVNPKNADSAIVVFSNYTVLSLFFTANGGTSWSNIGGNLEENTATGAGRGPSCRWATILPTSTGAQFYVATSTGLYSTSTLNGTSTVWALEGAGVIGNEVSTMVISRPADGLVAVATHGSGVFSAQAITSVPSGSSPVPETFSLAQNYPNPFNPSTTIQYVVPRTGTVSIEVYDVGGRHIATLAEGVKTAGTHSVTWNGVNDRGVAVSSGVYFCRFNATGFTSTRKMILMK